jgi:hypothetical protein
MLTVFGGIFERSRLEAGGLVGCKRDLIIHNRYFPMAYSTIILSSRLYQNIADNPHNPHSLERV